METEDTLTIIYIIFIVIALTTIAILNLAFEIEMRTINVKILNWMSGIK